MSARSLTPKWCQCRPKGCQEHAQCLEAQNPWWIRKSSSMRSKHSDPWRACTLAQMYKDSHSLCNDISSCPLIPSLSGIWPSTHVSELSKLKHSPLQRIIGTTRSLRKVNQTTVQRCLNHWARMPTQGIIPIGWSPMGWSLDIASHIVNRTTLDPSHYQTAASKKPTTPSNQPTWRANSPPHHLTSRPGELIAHLII